ncbi:MAG: hypothetical protein E7A79_09030 [Actinomycetaceae bacterium]|nr:hypothetical protein [Actinomycetaceae bacterium]
MATDVLLPTTPFGAWVAWLGMVMILAAAAAAGWIRILTHTAPAPRQLLHQDTLYELSRRERAIFFDQVDTVAGEVDRGVVTPSQAHLELAAILRALGTRATRQNLEVATTTEIWRAVGGVWPQFCQTLTDCQEPAFAAQDTADVGTMIERVRALIVAATQAADFPDPPGKHGKKKTLAAADSQRFAPGSGGAA